MTAPRASLGGFALLVSLALVGAPALADDAYLDAFDAQYGTAGSRLDTCGVCHVDFTGGDPALNPYGAAFETGASAATPAAISSPWAWGSTRW